VALLKKRDEPTGLDLTPEQAMFVLTLFNSPNVAVLTRDTAQLRLALETKERIEAYVKKHVPNLQELLTLGGQRPEGVNGKAAAGEA
jgi:hypothetical protein